MSTPYHTNASAVFAEHTVCVCVSCDNKRLNELELNVRLAPTSHRGGYAVGTEAEGVGKHLDH